MPATNGTKVRTNGAKRARKIALPPWRPKNSVASSKCSRFTHLLGRARIVSPNLRPMR